MKVFVTNIILGVMIIMLAGMVSPGSSYGKQLKLLCALVFTGMILSAISGLFNDYPNELSVFFNGELSDENAHSESYAGILEYVISDYRTNLEKSIMDSLYSEGIEFSDISVAVNSDHTSEVFGEIISVKIDGCDESDINRVKKIINSFYNVDYGNIYY
ncbi:MAG: hypothetical protein E7218_07180 [Anaerofustis stercorihominis]|nr:hypothetical protein [Anaerofustis stercorihominis]